MLTPCHMHVGCAAGLATPRQQASQRWPQRLAHSSCAARSRFPLRTDPRTGALYPFCRTLTSSCRYDRLRRPEVSVLILSVAMCSGFGLLSSLRDGGCTSLQLQPEMCQRH